MRRAPLRGERQGAALHPPLRGDAPKGSALWTPAPVQRAPLRGERQGAALHPPLRGDAPKGSALWTPAGAFAPDPGMLCIPTSPAGGTGDLVH